MKRNLYTVIGVILLVSHFFVLSYGVSEEEEETVDDKLYKELRWGDFDPNVVADLLAQGANAKRFVFSAPMSIGKDRTTPLHVAVRYVTFTAMYRTEEVMPQFNEIIDLLIRHGADVDVKDGRGRTPLRYAIEERALLPLIKKLLEHDASLTIEDAEGYTPLQYAELRAEQYPQEALAEIVEMKRKYQEEIEHWKARMLKINEAEEKAEYEWILKSEQHMMEGKIHYETKQMKAEIAKANANAIVQLLENEEAKRTGSQKEKEL